MKTTKCLAISVIFQISILLFAHAQIQTEIPRDSELDADTRAILQAAQKPAGIDSATWDRMVFTYKMLMSLNVDIQFFGQVLDPENAPLEGVEVSGYVNEYDNAILLNPESAGDEQKKVRWTATTDKNGRFVVLGMRGISLHTTAFEKEGYLAPEYDEYFRFSEKQFRERVHKPDAGNPVVFQMWPQPPSAASKKSAKGAGVIERVSLIKNRIKINGQGDGSQYHVDLVNGSFSLESASTGDLIVSVSSSPLPVDRKANYAWSFSLSVPGGGIIETEETHPYLAPTDGYKSGVTCEMPATDAQWKNSMLKKFYVQSRAGSVYSLIEVTVYAYDDGRSVVLINSIGNDSGSTNLMPLE